MNVASKRPPSSASGGGDPPERRQPEDRRVPEDRLSFDTDTEEEEEEHYVIVSQKLPITKRDYVNVGNQAPAYILDSHRVELEDRKRDSKQQKKPKGEPLWGIYPKNGVFRPENNPYSQFNWLRGVHFVRAYRHEGRSYFVVTWRNANGETHIEANVAFRRYKKPAEQFVIKNLFPTVTNNEIDQPRKESMEQAMALLRLTLANKNKKDCEKSKKSK